MSDTTDTTELTVLCISRADNGCEEVDAGPTFRPVALAGTGLNIVSVAFTADAGTFRIGQTITVTVGN